MKGEADGYIKANLNVLVCGIILLVFIYSLSLRGNPMIFICKSVRCDDWSVILFKVNQG